MSLSGDSNLHWCYACGAWHVPEFEPCKARGAGYRITLQITAEGSGYRVNASVDDRAAATTIENSEYEAAVIGVGLARRALAAWRAQNAAKR